MRHLYFAADPRRKRREARIDGEEDRTSEVFDLIENDWIVGERRLTCLPPRHPDHIPYTALDQTDWRERMAEIPEVDRRIFQNALEVASFLIADELPKVNSPDT